MKRLTQAEAAGRANERGIDLIGEFVNNRTITKFRCRDCSHEWGAIPSNVFHKTGCPICAKDKQTGRPKRQNKVLEDHGDWLLIDVSTKKHPDATMKIDTEDWERFKDNGAIVLNTDGYPMQYVTKSTVIHRVLLKPKKGLECDHINRDRADNRKRNLRLVTHTENMRNSVCYKHGRRSKAVNNG